MRKFSQLYRDRIIKRIHLLYDTEVADLYARPKFSANEQELYFTLNKCEQTALDRYTKIKTRVYFILQLGYFKAKQQFFNFDFENVLHDTRFILRTYYRSRTELTLAGRLSRNYTSAQKQAILSLFNYRDWSSKYESQVESHICELLRYYPKSHNALRQLFGYFDNQRIVIPTYRKLQDMFTNAFSAEEKRLNSIIISIPTCQQKKLSALISRKDGISQLNVIRADQKNFKYTAVKNEIEKAQGIVQLYTFTKEFIPTLQLSQNAIRHYADVAEQYAASRLRRLSKSQQWLHVICLVYHRYQQIMDNLIVSFMYQTRAIMGAAKSYAEKALMEHSLHAAADFPKLAHFLEWFPNRDKQLTHDGLNKIAYNILPEEQFSTLAEFFYGSTFDKKTTKWEFYLKSSRKFALYLRPIVLAVPFVFYKENSQIMELINLLKTHYTNGRSPSKLELPDDVTLIPKSMVQYLKRKPNDDKIDPHLFEFYVYQKIFHQIDRGRLCCNDSVSYCDIDHDLVADSLVDDVEKIATEFGYPKIPIYCDQRLDDAIEVLDNAWDTTTENIRLEQNSGFKIKETKEGEIKWNLLYDSKEKLDDTFFRTLPKVKIADVVMFVGDRIGMWDGFSHIKGLIPKGKSQPWWLLMLFYSLRHLVLAPSKWLTCQILN